jgi:uncharacterized protein YqeY
MTLKQEIDQDLKTAMLSGDSQKVSVLRGLKSAMVYAEVAAGTREQGLDDQAAMTVLAKEVKKRQESADLYKQGGSEDRAQAELAEKVIIEKYLPKQLSEAEVTTIVDKVFAEAGTPTMQDMGKLIATVRLQINGVADGALIARLVKERLSK